MKNSNIVKLAALTLVAAALMPIRANANPGDIYVSYNGHAAIRGTIYDYAPNGTGRVFASRLNGPRGMTFDGAGNLFASIGYAGTVVKFAPDGTQSPVASGLGFPEGLGFDSNGNLYVADSGGTLNKIAPDGTVSMVFSITGAFFGGVAVDGVNNVYVADAAAGVVYKFAGTLSTFASVPAAFGLAFDSAGNLFVSTQCEAFPAGNCTDPTIGGRIVKITPSGIQTTFASGLGDGDLRGLAFDALGNLFVADLGLAAGHDPSRAMVLKITPTGLVSVFASGVSNAEFVTIQP